MNCSLQTADVTDWVKQECVSNWLAHSVENLAEGADDDFFSVVSYIMKSMFYIRCYPNETIWLGPMNCDADAMNVG